MSKYLYNGIELPALPEWDKETYPYATISAYGMDIQSGEYALILYNEIPTWKQTSTDKGTTYKLGKSTGNKWYKYAVGTDSDWVANTPFGLLLANYVIDGKQEYRTICPVWSNTNLTDYDGSTLILASDPIPVPAPTLTESDFYRVINGAWVKCDTVKKMGNEWVTQDEYIVITQPLPIPDGCVTFSSAEAFTIATDNAKKNWDGTLYYSTDTETWSEWSGTTEIASGKHGKDQRLYIRGVGNTKITGIYNSNSRWVFNGGSVRCDGNAENLLDYTLVANGQHPTMAQYCLAHLFYLWSTLTNAPKLPATTLAKYCYYNMFCGCDSLISAPELPATTLAEYCYHYMFDGCDNLVNAPQLPATTLANRCYYMMFRSCKSLTKAPKLPATTLAVGCYIHMFLNCTSLTIPPELPAINLEELCYSGMFASCTSLVALPKLKATNLKFRCYDDMFSGCTSIKLSETQTGEYQTPYRIPTSGTGTAEDNALRWMFRETGGTFVGEPDIEDSGTPKINKTYYTSNTVV